MRPTVRATGEVMGTAQSSPAKSKAVGGEESSNTANVRTRLMVPPALEGWAEVDITKYPIK